MTDVWRRLQQACERLRPHVPRGGLNPPATDVQIREVEALVGYRFPDELREAYLHFNGATPLNRGIPYPDRCPPLLMPYFDWVDLDTMVQHWMVSREIGDDQEPWDVEDPWTQPFRPCSFHPGRLPIGVSNTSDHLVVDLDPTEFGRVGQLLRADPADAPQVEGTGLKACFERLLDALDAGAIRHEEAQNRWVDAAGLWVHSLEQALGPWPPLEPGEAVQRIETSPAPLPALPLPPPAFDDLRRAAAAWMPALLRQGERMPARGAHPQQIAHAEAVFGQRLPLEAAACWSALDGATGRYPRRWLDLRRATLRHREWRTRAALRNLEPVGPPSDDGTVREGPWRPGWVPVGEDVQRWYCLDLDPAPGGTPGQVIEIGYPFHEPPVDGPYLPPRRVAEGLAPWLWQAATGADAPEGFHQTPGGAAWRSLQAAPMQPGPGPTPAWSPRGWEPEPSIQGPKPLFPRRWRLFSTLQHEHPSSRVCSLGHAHHRAKGAATQLGQWAAGRVAGRALVVAPIGAGTTSLLRSAYAKMRAAWQADPGQPMPLLIDAACHAGVTSLQGLLDAEAARRGASAAGLLQSLADGRCALVVDHVESLLPAWPDAWTACDAVADARARVMFVCASEAFGSMAALQRAFDAHCAWATDGQRSGWLAVHADEENPGTLAQDRCRRLGLDVRPEVFRDPNPIGDLAARLGYFVLAAAWMVQPPGSNGSDPAGMQAWWRHLAARQPHCSADDFLALVLEALLVRWQPATPLPGKAVEALRPWLCAALGVRAPDGEATFHNGVRAFPLVHAMARDDDASFLALLQRILAQPPSDDAPTAVWVADFWRDLGHTTRWQGAARLLLRPQSPQVAGFLLVLGHELAKPWGGPTMREEWESQHGVHCRLTLPNPISRACTAGADLRGQALGGAWLAGIDLRGACLDGTQLHRARLDGAQLDGASMRGTQLAMASLRGARLRGVHASDAGLRDADLRDVVADGFTAERCDLRQARWNARWPGSTFVDCRTTDGLDPAAADGPSTPGPVPDQALPPWHCAAWSPCGRYVAVGGAARTLSLHDATTLQPLWCRRVDEGAALQLCFDAEGTHVLAFLQHGEVAAWLTGEPTPEGRLQRPRPGSITPAEDVCALRFDPVRRMPATLSRRGIEWYGTEWGVRVADWLQFFRQPPCRWTDAVFMGPPALLVLASDRGVETCEAAGVTEMDPSGHRTVGPRYPSLGSTGGRTLRAIAVRWAPAPADALDVSSGTFDTALLAVQAAGELLVGPLAGQALAWRAPVAAVGPPRFSPCGRWLAHGPALFEAATGHRHELPGPVLAFAADGRALVATSEGGRLVPLPC